MQREAALHELARRQHHHISRTQARELGVTRVEWHRLVASGGWLAVTDRVLRVAGAAPSSGERAMAAVLDAGNDAVASHSTAAWWWGLPGFGPTPLQLTWTSTSTRSTGLARVHRVRRLDPDHVAVLRGLPVVRPEVCILQLCATEHPGRVARALDNAWNLRLLSGRSLARLLARYGERGRNGTALLRQLLDERGEEYVPPASNVEGRAMRLFEQAGIAMVRQVDSGGEQWTGRVDFRAADLPLIVEVQSERYHTALLDRQADAVRRAQLERDGFVVVEVSDTELWQDPDVVIERVRAARRALRRAA